MTDTKPRFYIDYDDSRGMWSVFESRHDVFVAEFQDYEIANAVVACMKEVCNRAWTEIQRGSYLSGLEEGIKIGQLKP
jgi:hypothetical protein